MSTKVPGSSSSELFAAASAVGGLLANLTVIENLFDHVPETVFFLKDRSGRYLAVNQTLVERCGLRQKRELLGRHVREVFPPELAERFAGQDEEVLRTGHAVIDRLELHWYAGRRAGWCLTTKLPLRDQTSRVIGLAGISRDLRAPGDAEVIPASLVGALEHLESRYAERLTPALLARHARLSPVRFGRLIKRIFRLTPSQLIQQTRLAAASRLLAETTHSVAEVAVACGFYDHSAFSRAFRSATGHAPREYRASKRDR